MERHKAAGLQQASGWQQDSGWQLDSQQRVAGQGSQHLAMTIVRSHLEASSKALIQTHTPHFTIHCKPRSHCQMCIFCSYPSVIPNMSSPLLFPLPSVPAPPRCPIVLLPSCCRPTSMPKPPFHSPPQPPRIQLPRLHTIVSQLSPSATSTILPALQAASPHTYATAADVP